MRLIVSCSIRQGEEGHWVFVKIVQNSQENWIKLSFIDREEKIDYNGRSKSHANDTSVFLLFI